MGFGNISLPIVQAAGAVTLLYVGGEALVRGASALAARMGVSSLAIGLTVVAFGTSAPELAVSVDAAIAGANDISVGNVVGSNIANIALILGLAALIRPMAVQAKVVFLDAPLMILVSLLLLAVLSSGEASRLEGAAFAVGLCAYMGFTLWEARREPGRIREEFSSALASATLPLPWTLGHVVAGLLLLTGGGHLLVTAAVSLAEFAGVSQAAIGLTIVAVGTSLPELATSVVASARGYGDLAVGNVVGSNIFNIVGILGVTAMIRPLERGGIAWIDLGVMVALACALTVLLFGRSRLGRAEGAVLLTAFVAYTSWLLAFRT